MLQWGAGTDLLELFQGAWPVIPKQAGERTVGQEPASSLARRAIVRFVFRINDSLDWGAAHGAGQPVASVNRHPFPECRHLFRKTLSRFLAQPLRPFHQSLARSSMETRDFILPKLVGPFEW